MERVLIRFLLCCVLFLTSISNVNAAAFVLSATKDQTPGIDPGIYDLVSKVAYHDHCPAMAVGDKSFSKMKISNYNGHLYANWHAEGWKTVRVSEVETSGSTIDLKQEAKTYNDKGAYVYVRMVHKIKFTGDKQMKITSYNKMYEDGKPVCSYMLTTYGFAKK